MEYFLRTYASLLLLAGSVLAGGGIYLLTLHGSPYFFLCGIGLVGSGFLLWCFRGTGAMLYGINMLVTLAWAVWDAGFDAWALTSRLLALTVLGSVLLLPTVRRALVWPTPLSPRSTVFGVAALALAAGFALRTFVPPHVPIDPIYQAGTIDPSTLTPIATPAHDDGDWRNYGNDPGGSRFSALTQITPANVANLKLTWSYRIDFDTFLEATPLKVDRTLYICANGVIALNAETGKELWHFPGPAAMCRGVAYYREPGRKGACAERIITSEVEDARFDVKLIALDAQDGKPCSDFGTGGAVSLLSGLGEVTPEYYDLTSAPAIIRDKIVVGARVMDGQYWGEPSGVVRGFDAVTGRFAWAWDMGHPDWNGEPPAGERYTPSTPNSWAPMSVDEDLGLVYVPTGNTTGSDFFGGSRRPFDEKYSSAVVALDAGTGRPRWSFQTTHHDLWDYDLASQPTLIDFPKAGGVAHALVQATKRGELFVLDRATGAPIYPIEERAAPHRGAVPDEQLSRTQPYSIGLPSFRGADLTEGDMWGLTPLDQMWCRIKFREARYDGPTTPPGLTPSIQSPSVFGGMNWGGVAVDSSRSIVLVNANYLPNYLRLLPRAEADQMGLKRFDPLHSSRGASAHLSLSSLWRWAQEGTPYGVLQPPFLSPLKVPCTRPPYGRLSAVDLRTGKLVWTQYFGSARDLGPLSIPSRLPIPIGTPNFGGAVVTQSGLFFIGATQDRYLRAYETVTGTLLWQTPLPAAGRATPMTYRSPETGRQFVVIASGPDIKGEDITLSPGGYILAFALPVDGK